VNLYRNRVGKTNNAQEESSEHSTISECEWCLGSKHTVQWQLWVSVFQWSLLSWGSSKALFPPMSEPLPSRNSI
jgi:hypothetical protein